MDGEKCMHGWQLGEGSTYLEAQIAMAVLQKIN